MRMTRSCARLMKLRVSRHETTRQQHPNLAGWATVLFSSRHPSNNKTPPLPPSVQSLNLTMAPVCEPLCHFGGRCAYVDSNASANINILMATGYSSPAFPTLHHARMSSIALQMNWRTGRVFVGNHRLAHLRHLTAIRSTTTSR